MLIVGSNKRGIGSPLVAVAHVTGSLDPAAAHVFKFRITDVRRAQDLTMRAAELRIN